MNRDSVLGTDALTQFENSPRRRQFAATDVNDLVQTVARCSKPYLSENTVLAIETSSDLPQIRGDQERLTDVLFALLFRSERSTVIADRKSSMIRIRTGATDGEVRLHLSDDGSDRGLGESVAPGLLLGLTQCAQIISDHGGCMCSWRPHKGGATYTISFPSI